MKFDTLEMVTQLEREKRTHTHLQKYDFLLMQVEFRCADGIYPS